MVVKLNSSVRSLMECIDDCGYYVSVINGFGHNYVRGINVPVLFDHQSNTSCLREYSEDTLAAINPMTDACMVKQHTTRWKEIRDRASVTGSTWYSALGLTTLKDLKAHFDQVNDGTKIPVSPELQELFVYGTANEINGIATFVAKYLPVYIPHHQYQEDGCQIIQLTEQNFAVIVHDIQARILSNGTIGRDYSNHTSLESLTSLDFKSN